MSFKSNRSRRNQPFDSADDMEDTERTLNSDHSEPEPVYLMESTGPRGSSLVPYSDQALDRYIDEEESQCVHEIMQDGKHSRGLGRHRVRNIVWAVVLLVMIAIIVTLSVLLSQQKKAEAAASSSTASLANTDIVPLPPVPEGLKQMCEQGYIEHQTGNSNLFDTCQNSCAVADCCLLPPNIPGTCLTEGVEPLCMEYHQACSALVDSSNLEDDSIKDSRAPPTVIPLAPPELEMWCSPNSLVSATSSQQCRATCNAYACCWADVAMDSKYAGANRQCSLKQNCGSYWPCTYLQAQDSVHAGIADHVNQACQPSSVRASTVGHDMCREACKAGLCCLAPDPAGGPARGGNDGNCRGKPPGFCDQYSACYILEETIPLEGGTGADDGGDDDDNTYGDDVYGDDDTLTDDPLASGDDTPTGDDDYYYGDDDATAGDDDDAATGTGANGTTTGVTNGANNQSTGNQNKFPLVPPPLPSNIALICNQTAVQATDDSFNSCIKLCSQAHCCKVDVSSGAQGSCFANHQWLCTKYATYCASLEELIDDYYGDDDGNFADDGAGNSGSSPSTRKY